MTSKAKRFSTPVAIHLFLIQGDQVLLIRRCNTGYEDGNYSVIAGHLDGGETVTSAMCREAYEEGGIELDHETLQPVGMMHRLALDGERIDVFFAADRWKGQLRNLEPDKCDEFRWVSPDRLPHNTVPYVASAIRTWRSGA